MLATDRAITVRCATEADDLTVLFPEATGRKLNLEQVLLATDGRILGGALLFHAGHDLAYVGAIRFSGSERQPWVIHALWRGVEAWCRARGVVEVLHAASTRECAVAFERLGARPVRRDDVVLGLRLDHRPEAPDAPQDAPVAQAALRFRFVSPFDPEDKEALRHLITSTHAIVQDRPWPWDFVFPTLGAWDGDRLAGYVQFSVGLFVTFDYGLRVHPDYRSLGLGRRLLSLWLRFGARYGCKTALSGAMPGNAVMERLLESVGFERQGHIPGLEQAEVLYVGGARVFNWALEQPMEYIAWP